jgi:hypothetical protein
VFGVWTKNALPRHMAMPHNKAMPRKKSDRIVLKDLILGTACNCLPPQNQIEVLLAAPGLRDSFTESEKAPK